MEEKIIITTPSINESTLNEMKKFFSKTSFPRIIAEKENQKKGA